MSLLSALLEWFVGSAILWGLWMGYTSQNHIDKYIWGFFTIVFAIMDVVALVGMIKRQVE